MIADEDHAGSLPLPLYVEVDVVRPSLAERDWRVGAARRQGRSHAVLLTGGSGTATLTQGRVLLAAPTFLWLPAGTVEHVRLAAGSGGYLLSVGQDLISRAVSGSRNPGTLLGIADRLVHLESAAIAGKTAPFELSLSAIDDEIRENAEGGFDVAAAHVTILLTLAWRRSLVRLDNPTGPRSGSMVFQRFLQSVELHFREHWGVSRYAAVLGVTERRLHMAATAASGRSPLALIHQRVLLEARTRLAQSSAPVAQVAYGLGFRDAAHFSRFFRKLAGETPGAYRRRLQSLPAPDRTFAAWP